MQQPTHLWRKKIIKVICAIVCAWFLLWVFLVIAFRPSHDRDWEFGQEKLPSISLDGDVMRIENFRDFDWTDEVTADARYATRSFALSEMTTTDVFISHFDEFEGLTHIFLSFGFSDGRHIVVSMETRREKGEEFSPFLGVLRQFEIIYVVGSERDIVGLRTDIRDERVYLYQTIASPEISRELFLKIAEDINGVFAQPRIYNTLTDNCTNVLTRRVEDISDRRFPLTWKTVFPGYFDEVLYDMNLLVTHGDFSLTKQKSFIENASVDRRNPQFESMLRQ